MRFRALLFVLLSASALALACGKDDPKPAAGVIGNDPTSNASAGGSGTPGSDAATSTVDSGTCSSLAIGSASIAQTTVNDTIPTGTGGTIVDGTYDLETDDKYVGVTGTATNVFVTSTISIASSVFQRVETQISAANVTTTTNVSGTISVSGVDGVIALDCPLITSTSITYTMGTDGSSLVLYDSTTNEGRTYRLR